MTVEKSWRPAIVPYPERIHVGTLITMWQDPPKVVEQLVEAGVLVEDTRLQAIADAWDEYKEFASQSGAMAVLRERMDDALTEEDKDG